MKLRILTIALAATALGSFGAAAQTVIEERRTDPSVTIEERHHDTPAVRIEKREPAVRIEKRETTGRGDCDSKTIHKEGLEGSTTIKKTRCD